MSKSIDVLAEIQQAHATLKEWASVTGMTDDHVQADAMEEARAAVAELIDAAEKVHCVPCHGSGVRTVRVQGDLVVGCDPYPCRTCAPLRTALARVRGAA